MWPFEGKVVVRTNTVDLLMEKIDDLFARVAELESQEKLQVQDGFTYKFGSSYCSYPNQVNWHPGMVTQAFPVQTSEPTKMPKYHDVPLVDAVKLILDRMGVELEVKEGKKEVESSVVLKKRVKETK